MRVVVGHEKRDKRKRHHNGRHHAEGIVEREQVRLMKELKVYPAKCNMRRGGKRVPEGNNGLRRLRKRAAISGIGGRQMSGKEILMLLLMAREITGEESDADTSP